MWTTGWKILKNKTLKVIIFVFIVFYIIYSFLFFFKPSLSRNESYATIILDKNNEIIASRTSIDKQWRLKNTGNELSNKYISCLITYEDQHFYSHFGIDFKAIARAAKTNIMAHKIKSGGSTITMQLVRLLDNRKGKSYYAKIKEILFALWIEIAYSKNEILLAYTQVAPFGSNIVGLEAASWKYFEKKISNLSWSEAALLAILPNNPSQIFPGKNNNILLKKRNNLLKKLVDKNIISSKDFNTYCSEPLPKSIIVFDNIAPHLLDYFSNKNENNVIFTTISKKYQDEINNILIKNKSNLSRINVHNACVLVVDVKQNNIIAYAGNIPNISNKYSKDVDIIQAPRSTGSILKPLLFAMNLNEGKLLSSSLVADIPTIIAGYAPKNFDLTYDGAVSFSSALHRSLNVPAVRILQDYGIEKFHHNLTNFGITTLTKPASHYGLTLILGGAEATLWDLCKVYANMAKNLKTYTIYNSYLKYDNKCFKIIKNNDSIAYSTKDFSDENILGAGAIYQTFEAMNEVARPDEEEGWKLFSNQKIAWKTGTSFGNRDAWAIGCTPEYVVGVWAGNANGVGAAEHTGIKSAAPILFDVFNILNPKEWFEMPQNDVIKAHICEKSGFRKGNNCEKYKINYIPKSCSQTSTCSYCNEIFVDKTEKFRVNKSCENESEMILKKYFSLPPAMEYYYKSKNASYKILPVWKSNCGNISLNSSIEIIYPLQNSKIFVPKVINSKKGSIVFQAAYKGMGKLYWHIDTEFVCETEVFHQLTFTPKTGKHILTVEDSQGNTKKVNFEIINP